MPKKPIDWSKCIIYKIYKDGVDDFYIGSTTQFIKRKNQHKSASKIDEKKKIYKIIRDNGGWDEWIMTAIEEYKDCENQTQARIREEEWRFKLNATMNTLKAYLSIEEKKEYYKEYYKINIDKIKKQSTDYYNKNSDKIKKQSTENYNKNIDKNKEIIYCDCCKKDINKRAKVRHYKTQLHINNAKPQ
jgi:hypothetical protein